MGIVSESCPPEALKNPHKHLHALVSPRSIPLKYFGVTHIQAFELVLVNRFEDGFATLSYYPITPTHTHLLTLICQIIAKF